MTCSAMQESHSPFAVARLAASSQCLRALVRLPRSGLLPVPHLQILDVSLDMWRKQRAETKPVCVPLPDYGLPLFDLCRGNDHDTELI